MASKPKWQGPYDRPTSRAGMETDGERLRYFVTARFIRIHPFWLNSDAALYFNDQAMLYDVDIRQPAVPSTGEETGKALIIDDDPVFLDALKVAEERRQQLGLKRKDLLWGPLNEPITNPYPKPLMNEVDLD